MRLKEILQKIAETEEKVILSDQKGDWSAENLLERLSEPMLNRQAYLQPGLYIAEINSAGFLGSVLFKVKNGI